LLFNPNDIQELQNQLKILISNPDFRNHIAVNLKLEVIENYSREKIIQAVVQKYAAILV
jgi:glycosyltransferase involved in cell wall biosynthesis